MVPVNLLKLINSKDEKTVLSENFKIEGSLKIRTPYVCYSHIQTIIDDYAGKLRSPRTPFEQRLLSFIRRNKKSMNHRKKRKARCTVCNMQRMRPELYEITSKGIRTVIMIGCILRGTLSVC
ncbi:hypothetical protein B9Z55_026889 [Caenorhabditis nigoni]|uniref:Lin-15A/B-like domain-containing protein n=1 Tax=Caenorhabditis nigoni TaxID=1611254 RepID=A0A2G5SHR4_9PELO|nr:hypothetical protein B9Z55_026889 [Caenorhabditis nigoni]